MDGYVTASRSAGLATTPSDDPLRPVWIIAWALTPRRSRAAAERDEVTPFPLTEMHQIPSRAGSTWQDIGSGTR